MNEKSKNTSETFVDYSKENDHKEIIISQTLGGEIWYE